VELHIINKSSKGLTREDEMIIIEFSASNGPKYYFVGKSKGSVLADTKNGTGFGGAKFVSNRIITEQEARSLGLGHLDEGINAIQDGSTKSFALDRPK